MLAEDGRSLAWRYGTLDRRDLFVYDLQLTPRERRLLLARLWVQLRDGGHTEYSFFSVNCARLTHDTLRAVLPELARRPGWLRARLPPAYPPRLDAFPAYAILPSGSNRVTVAGGFDGAQVVTRLRRGVVDEQPGEARAVSLRRSARFEFLVTELALAWPEPGWPAVLDTRFTPLSSVDHGTHVRTVDGPLGARSDLLVDTGVFSSPANDVWVGGWLRVGGGLTLAAAEDDTAFLVVGVDMQVWGEQGDAPSADPLRGEAGGWLEATTPLSGLAHHLRLRGRWAPGYGLTGYGSRATVDGRLDLPLSGRLGRMLSPYGA